MMSKFRIRAGVSVFLVALMFPGTIEIVENVMHYAQFGHFSVFEDIPGHHHHRPGPEGSCPNSAHVCGVSPIVWVFLGFHHSPESRPTPFTETELFSPQLAFPSGFGTLPFRPPIA